MNAARRAARGLGKEVTSINVGDALWRHLADELGDSRAKKICEDLALVLANHDLVHSPDLCKALFYHMITVTEGWNSV